MNLFLPPDAPCSRELENLLTLIDRLYPLPQRFRTALPRDVADLSRLLTSERPRRDMGYLGRPAMVSAYIRYFLPWNVYRLIRLLPQLPLNFAPGDAIVDIGSGPLTLPIALWICRPDLRTLPLEFRCLDRTGPILDAGKKIIDALMTTVKATELSHATACVQHVGAPWKIRTIRGSLGDRIEGKKARLVTAINVFNELFWDEHEGPRKVALRNAPMLAALADPEGSILVVEPGIPRSGEFIFHLRSELMSLGRLPLAPCTHTAACPLPAGRRGAKWCHFAFDTEKAPEALHRLSRAAGLPKERATMSFLFAGPVTPDSHKIPAKELVIRILSDPFPVAARAAASKSLSRAAHHQQHISDQSGRGG
ncbi:MAG: small ribosomal subunit Rsm22 family protein, partial [Termitinemataceae bacterium]